MNSAKIHAFFAAAFFGGVVAMVAVFFSLLAVQTLMDLFMGLAILATGNYIHHRYPTLIKDDPDKISVARKGELIGLYSREKAKEYFASGQLLPTDWGWHDGMREWKPLWEVLEARRPTIPPEGPQRALRHLWARTPSGWRLQPL